MIIKEYDKYDEYECRGSYTITALSSSNECVNLSFYDGEPEDNTLGRNFNDVYNILTVIKMAYDAGKNREDLVVEHYNEKD